MEESFVCMTIGLWIWSLILRKMYTKMHSGNQSDTNIFYIFNYIYDLKLHSNRSLNYYTYSCLPCFIYLMTYLMKIKLFWLLCMLVLLGGCSLYRQGVYCKSWNKTLLSNTYYSTISWDVVSTNWYFFKKEECIYVN